MQMTWDPDDGSALSYTYRDGELSAFIQGETLMKSYNLRNVNPHPTQVINSMLDLHARVTGDE